MSLKPGRTKASSDKQFVLKFLGNGKYKYTLPLEINKLLNTVKSLMHYPSFSNSSIYPCLVLILFFLNKPVFGKYAKELLWCGLNSPQIVMKCKCVH